MNESAVTAVCEPLLTPEELATFLGGDYNVRTLEQWRRRGTGPDYIKIGGRTGYVRYRIAAVNRWLDSLERKPGEVSA